MEKLDDNSLMPYGQHKGVKMANVPAKDLIWLYENDRASKSVKVYVEENLDVLREEIKRNSKK